MINYNPHEWTSHLFDYRGSLIREIMPRTLACTFWAAFVVAGCEILDGKFISILPIKFTTFEPWQRGSSVITIPTTLHSLVGIVLGMLLVFRTNSSYDRFWEGRKLWGGIVNETRNLARSASVHLAGNSALRNETVRWTIAMPYAIMNRLRGKHGFGPFASRLDRVQMEASLGADHLPLEISRRITSCLRKGMDAGHYTDVVFQGLDNNVQLLVDYFGACERIHKTPLPYAYMVHLRRAMILYLYALPLALYREFGWTTVIATLAMSFAFFGIEEIGVEIEDPFEGEENDLPLEDICATIDRDLSSLIGDRATE